MPLYIDRHKRIPGLTRQAAASAHQRDLERQARYGVEYLKYWVNQRTGDVFCLVRAPSEEAAVCVHREAHGLFADEICEVEEGS